MSTVSYREFTGTAAENYQRYFVPAIATPVSAALLETAACSPASTSSTPPAVPASSPGSRPKPLGRRARSPASISPPT
jgi:hypothetical protein